MKTTFYELTKEEEKLNQLFEDSIDEETGEVIDGEILDELREELQIALQNKSVGIIKVARQKEINIEMVDAEIKRLQHLKKVMQNENERFKQNIKFCMQQLGEKKIETPIGKINIRQSTATDVYNEEALPKEFLKEKVSYSADKASIKKALQAGQEVDGARLVINTNVTIK